MERRRNKISNTYDKRHRVFNDIEQKQCLDCKQWFDMNLDNFREDKCLKDGFNSRCRSCQTIKDHQFYMKNREDLIKRSMNYKQNHKEQYQKVDHEYYLKIKPEKRKKHRQWCDEHDRGDYLREYRKTDAFKRSVKRSQEFRNLHKKHEISKEEWNSCKDYFENRCCYCGLPIEQNLVMRKGILKQFDFCKDHVENNGANDLSNCAPACESCNNKKKTIPLEEWYNEENPVYSKERYIKLMRWLLEDYKLYIKS